METLTRLKSVFPTSIPFPPLLAKFVEWAGQVERGQLGWFGFEGQRLDDFWIENGSALAEQFALFIHLPEGSMIGFWKPEGQESRLPVVLLGSEGAQEILGSTLEEFLWNWAKSELSQAYDLMPSEDGEDEEERLEDARPALAAWLQSESVLPLSASVPDLQAFFADWQEQQEARWLRDNDHQALGAILKTQGKAEMQEWESVEMKVDICGTDVRITTKFGIDVKNQDLTGLCVQLRETMALSYPDRGLWYSAWFNWYPSDRTTIRAEYLELPGDADWALARADLARFPRSAFWTPEWAE